MVSSRPERSSRFVDDVEETKPPAGVDGAELRVTLVNHSTVLLQQSGLQHSDGPDLVGAGESVWRAIGPRRRRKPGVRWEDLPRIDVVLLSHNHYDHLDLAVVAPAGGSRRIAVRCSGGSGAAAAIAEDRSGARTGLGRIGVDSAETRIHGVPALHFSARGLFDRNRTLWCGYVIETCGADWSISRETRLSGIISRMIRERFGAPRVALLPIGAYEPRWFMSRGAYGSRRGGPGA